MVSSYQSIDAALSELSPLRQHRAAALFRFLGVHRKHLLSGRAYELITRELGIPAHAIDQAVDDLWSLGVLEVRIVGGIPVVSPAAREARA